MIANFGTSNADGDGVVHSGAHDKSRVTSKIYVDSDGDEGGGDTGYRCWGVGDRCVSGGVSASKPDGDSIEHSGADDEDIVARDIDVGGARAKDDCGRSNDSFGVGDL